MQVEVAVLGFQVLIYCPYGLCGRKATLNERTCRSRNSIRSHTAGYSFMVLNRKRRACWGLGKNGIGSESPGPAPCSHSSRALNW